LADDGMPADVTHILVMSTKASDVDVDLVHVSSLTDDDDILAEYCDSQATSATTKRQPIVVVVGVVVVDVVVDLSHLSCSCL